MLIALVDDDPSCIEDMTRYCHEFAAQQRQPFDLLPFRSGEEFLSALETHTFTIVFLDIYMKGITGLEAAKALREHDPRCLLIFLTSSPDFMPDAFSCHAFDYLVKPVSAEQTARVLRDALRALPPSPQYIELTSGRKTVSVLLEEVTSVVSDAHYLEISLSDGRTLRIRMTMSGFLEIAGEDPRFIYINKGILVNAEFVADFENNSCLLENGRRFPVRVRDARKVEQAVRDYHFSKLRGQQRH